jgi:hypothetical protein
MAQQINIYQVIKPIYYFEKLLGFIPFTVDFKKKETKRTIFDATIGLFHGLFFFCSLILMVYEFNISKDPEKVLFETGLRINLIFGAAIGALVPLINSFLHSSLQSFYREIDVFDQKVQQLEFAEHNKKQKLFGIILFIVFQCFFGMTIFLVFYVYEKWNIQIITVREIFAFLILALFFMAHNILVIFSLFNLKMRFQIINEALG